MRYVKRALRWLLNLLCALAALAALFVSVAVFARWPLAYDRAALTRRATSTVLLDRDGQPFSIPGQAQSTATEELPETTKAVFVSAEDARFYTHAGVDVVRVFGSLLANLRSGSRAQGGSTITQQLVKNKLLSNEKTYLRKAVEAIYALQVEQDLTKDEILSLYLDCAYFGKGATGLTQAAWVYFSKSPQALTLVEAAALAACLRAPSSHTPHLNPERNAERRAYIFGEMERLGVLSAEEAAAAAQTPLELRLAPTATPAAWYADAALEEAADLLELSLSEIETGGYTIHTGLDAWLQSAIETVTAPASPFPPDAADGTPCQSALAAVQPGTGEVLALVGGRNYTARHGFNRARDALRQPGSALKPLAVYAPALQRRIVTADSLLLDAPTDFDGYAPRNHNERYYGLVTLRLAAALSLNVPAVKLLDAMHPATGYEYLSKFGLEPTLDDQGLSLAVGSMTKGVSPLRLAAAYAALEAGGLYAPPAFVTAIAAPDGTLVYRRTAEIRTVLDGETAANVLDLLRSTAHWGTAKALAGLGEGVAGKTGTVDYKETYNRDAWCVACLPGVALSCWMGFDRTDEAHALPGAVTGGSLPAHLCAAALAGWEEARANKGNTE